MRATIFVRLKRDVLDPEGDAIAEALARTGASGIESVRVGKVFEIEVAGRTRQGVVRELEKMAQELLANPVTEDFEIRIDD